MTERIENIFDKWPETATMSEELKRCPFCGGEAIEKEPDSRAPFNRRFWVIQCQNCYANIGGSHRRMNREAWNRRVNETVINGGEVTINL